MRIVGDTNYAHDLKVGKGGAIAAKSSETILEEVRVEQDNKTQQYMGKTRSNR